MADRIIHCTHDGRPHPAIELFCSQCKSKLSLVRPGEDFLNHRFAVLKADHETEASLCWLVMDRVAGGNRILREIFPAADAAPGGKHRFDALCTTLREAPADVFPRSLLHFSREGRCYVVEEVPEGTPLEEALSPGALGEERASGYFWSLIESLATLESAHPPLYHGALRASAVRLRANGKPPLLTDPACIEHTVTRDHPMISEAAAQQDLRDAADLAFRMLNGSRSESIPSVLGRIRDDAFTSVLDWALLPDRSRPCFARDLLHVRDLVAVAERARKEGRDEEALAQYDQALAACHASRLQKIVGDIRERRRKVLPPLQMPLRCDSCNLTFPPDRKFCAKCGKPLQARTPDPPTTAEPKMCPVCRRIYDAAGVTFCIDCGNALVDSPKQPQPPPPAPPEETSERTTDGSRDGYNGAEAPVQEPVQKEEPKEPDVKDAPTINRTSPFTRILTGCAVVVLALATIFFAFRSDADAKFDSAVARGALVAPAGDNAYEIYQAAQKEGRSVEKMEKKALPILRSRAEAQLQRNRDGDLTTVEWQELQKIYEWLAKISGTNEDRAGVAYATGRLALQNSDFSAAFDSFQRALQLRPGWNYALNSLGRTSVRLSNLDAAISFYEQAVKADPSWVVPRLNLGASYVRQRRFDEAEAQYAQALKLDGSRPTTHFLLAQLYDAKGGDARRYACQQYRDALRLNQGQTGTFDVAWTERRVNRFCVSAGY
jgi:tetratricopeptide (TPR) repeat protein